MTMKKNQDSIVSYIKQLVNIPSPTGFTKQIENFLIANAKEKGIAYEYSKKGAVIYKFTPKKETDINTLFAAHVDALGAIVKEVNDDGLKILPIGGASVAYSIGDYCKVHTYDNKTYSGTILPKNPAAHVRGEIDKLDLKYDNLLVRMDIVAENSKKLKDYIEVGNFISLDPKFEYINGFVKSRHLDDKASAAVLLYIADIIKDKTKILNENIYMYFNITEETGQGISALPEMDNMIVVDMGCVGDGVSGDEFNVSICAKDSSGPYNYDLTQQLIKISKDQKLAYKVDVFPYYASDGSGALRAGTDARVALIGPGVSASHGYERTHIDALKNTTNLILGYLEL